MESLKKVRRSVPQESIEKYLKWNEEFGDMSTWRYFLFVGISLLSDNCLCDRMHSVCGFYLWFHLVAILSRSSFSRLFYWGLWMFNISIHGGFSRSPLLASSGSTKTDNQLPYYLVGFILAISLKKRARPNFSSQQIHVCFKYSRDASPLLVPPSVEPSLTFPVLSSNISLLPSVAYGCRTCEPGFNVQVSGNVIQYSSNVV